MSLGFSQRSPVLGVTQDRFDLVLLKRILQSFDSYKNFL
jgi:hypothetical protein